MKTRALLLSMVPGIFLLSGCLILPFPHTDLDSFPYSGRVLDASTRHPVAGAKVMVQGLPKTSVLTDSSGHFLTGISISWCLVSEDTVDGDLRIPGNKNQGYLLVTHPAYHLARVEVDDPESDYPVFASGTNFKVRPLDDILLHRQH